MGKRIYLDHNVVVDVYQCRRAGLRELIDARKAAGDTFVYSPAHLEEIAVVLRCATNEANAQRMVEEQVALIAELTDTWEVLPAFQGVGASRVVQEHPSKCLERVLEHYHLTLSSEAIERFQLSWKSEKAFDQVQEEIGTGVRAGPGVELFPAKRNRLGIAPGVTNISPENVFEDTGVLAALMEKLWNYDWNLQTLPRGELLIASHADRERLINALFKVLEQVGYYADSFAKSRSHMHDVTHAIYAAVADVLVTGDERYAKRVRAIYHFLGLNTRVELVRDWVTESATE